MSGSGSTDVDSMLVAARPGPGTPGAYRFPAVVRRHLAGGAVVAAHLPGQPLAVAMLLLDAGAAREPGGREGVASVLAEALAEGTAARDATAYALALEGLGTGLSTAATWDAFRASVMVPVDRLPAAAELLAEAVRTPRFDPTDVRRVRDDAVTALRMSWAEPGPRADAVLRAELFGTDQRHGRPMDGDPTSVAAIDVSDVVDFHAAWFGHPGTLLVVGDLDRIDLDRLAGTVFAGTGGDSGPADENTPFATPLHDRPRVLLIDRPGSVQSTLRLGHSAPHRTHPDHVANLLAGTVLGGSFTSRLNHLIREVRGYTYGMRADFGSARRFGRFLVTSSVQSGVTGPALEDTIGEITRTHADGVTEEELVVARTWRAGQLMVEMQTPGAIVEALATLVLYRLPDDYHATLREQLLEASAAQVSAAAGRHLRPSGLTLVVEGDARAVRPQLLAAGLGEVLDVDPETLVSA